MRKPPGGTRGTGSVRKASSMYLLKEVRVARSGIVMLWISTSFLLPQNVSGAIQYYAALFVEEKYVKLC